MTGTAKGAEIAAHLTPIVRDVHGERAQVRDVGVMEDGHAGLTFGFDVASPEGESLGRYILKLGPPGVPRRGSTDVYRQAQLLSALHTAGLPVPRIAWASSSEDGPLGAPFIVMERLPGRVFVIWEPHASFDLDTETVRSLWFQCIRALGAFHALDWTTALKDWETPYTLDSELVRWNKLLRHAPEPQWLEAGQRLHAALVAQKPDEAPIGLVHGDYQPGNVLYDDGRLHGVIDWDLAGIGAQGIDVGWIMMMIDQAAWAEGWKPIAPITRDEVLSTYRAAGGTAFHDLDWFQAFAQFRLGAIACLNVKLNRDGRRPDLLWERFAPSISTLFARAEALLAVRASRPAGRNP
jgi:aminoglycoside phosphotransferase (APT) family kinase protein